jgi:ABC-2 type transport system permease protein
MNWTTFFALLARDAHVARRNVIPLLMQTFLQPMMFVFIFGRVMVSSGYMPAAYKSLLLPGIMAISMVFTGVWAVAMPLIRRISIHARDRRPPARADRNFMAGDRESIFGTLQAIVAGVAVIPLAWLLLRPVDFNLHSP